MRVTIEQRRYLLVFSLTVALVFSGGAALSYFGDSFEQFEPYQMLTAHQLKKARDARGIDTLLLGDSAMGNAIDAGYFSELTGTRALNLAFTENFGFASDYNLLKALVRTNPVKHVILMHTPHTFAQRFTLRGYFLTMSGPSDLTDLGGVDAAKLFDALTEVFLTFRTQKVLQTVWRRLTNERTANWRQTASYLATNDYVPQGAALQSVSEFAGRILADKIVEEKLYFLRKIAATCQERGIKPIYLHAPLVSGALEASREYLARVNVEVRKLGFVTVDGALPLSQETVGDEFDHVAPKVKRQFTKAYAAELEPLITR